MVFRTDVLFLPNEQPFPVRPHNKISHNALSLRQSIVSSYLKNQGETILLENQVGWETPVFQLTLRKIEERFGLKGSTELWSKVLWTWVEGRLYDSFDVLNIIAVISPVNN